MCVVITGSAVGYVWQKGEIDQLGQDKHRCEVLLTQLKRNNQRLLDQIAILHSPLSLDQRVKELNLGLVPLLPGQVVRLAEPTGTLAGERAGNRQMAERSDD